MDKVYVYRFTTVHEKFGTTVTAPRMATLAVIRKAGGIVHSESARLVRENTIDADGFYPKKSLP